MGKKKNKIDDDGPISKKVLKKQKKNLSKTLNADLVKEEYAARQAASVIEVSPPKPKLKKGPDRMIDDIKAILPNHREETIRRVLEKHSFNQADALEELFEIPEDKIGGDLMESFEEMEKPQKKGKKTKQEEANEFLGEIYEKMEEGLEMNPTEFEELFQEITYIIQEEQRGRGVGIVEINDFVDSCESIKSHMMEGHELYIDENDPIFVNTEAFMYQIIQRNAQLEKKRQEDFPSLDSLDSKKQHSPGEKNIIQKIHDNYKIDKSKEELFTPSKVPSLIKNTPSFEGSIYSLNDDFQSHEAVKQLSREYNNMKIENLKFIYFRLENDVNLCKEFLQQYYPDKKSVIKSEVRKPVQEVRPQRKTSYELRKRVVDSNYKNWSLAEIREELDHLYKLRNMFRITRGKITNQAYRKELQRLACREDPTIQKLAEAARIKTIAQMADSHPQDVDLHGYREEEVDDLLAQIRTMIREEVRKGNSSIQIKRTGGVSSVVVNIMTGKGRHSKYGKSVLKPAVKSWSEAFGFKNVENEDSVDVFFPIN